VTAEQTTFEGVAEHDLVGFLARYSPLRPISGSEHAALHDGWPIKECRRRNRGGDVSSRMLAGRYRRITDANHPQGIPGTPAVRLSRIL
jgi:hypothetical protein